MNWHYSFSHKSDLETKSINVSQNWVPWNAIPLDYVIRDYQYLEYMNNHRWKSKKCLSSIKTLCWGQGEGGTCLCIHVYAHILMAYRDSGNLKYFA